ncbi:MAG: DNA-binding response regulator [Chitinophaga sp.]|jgi:DNA-binding NarL/FixJ family response regulator|nr:DNA-binding response regulator [Chitinophaga sp.]
MRIKVAIFEDDAVRLNGLQMLLNTADGFECTGAFDNAINVINKIIVSSPDVVIMDIGLPSVNGIDAVKEIKQEFPYLPVLMQTVFDKDEKIFESIMAGATGYLLKKTAPEKLLEAIQDIYRGGAPMTPEIATKVLTFFRNKEDAKASAYALSDKEKRVLAYLVEGLSYKMISDKLHISYHTVNFHIRNIYHKLHVHTVSEAVAKAIKENIV